jgi:hypothetical protein
LKKHLSKLNQMQLYTEEQVLKIIFATKQWNNLSSDYLISTVTPIELPSNEEIKDKSFNKFTQSNARTCFEEGAKWMREKILNQKI